MPRKYQYWFEYSKRGTASFHSHLDTVRIFKRALRRSGLDVRFTSGFNPHIRFSTPNALPVGLAVRAERVSLCFNRAYDPEEAARILDRCLPEGFGVRAARDQAVEEEPETADQRLEFEVSFAGDDDAVREAAGLWAEQEKIAVEKIEIGPSRILMRIGSVGGRLPRLSELLQRIHAMSEYGESTFAITGVTRL